jgi:hypothetical protein
LSGLRSKAYAAVGPRLWNHDNRSEGHDPSSPYFWGDVCHERIDYWRNFTFATSDVTEVVPGPYHDPARPLVRWWYAATHAPHRDPFLAAVAPAQLDRLERSGGACILYTHFGTNFVWEGDLYDRFEPAMQAVVDRGAWVAPASEVLDHLRAHHGDHVITDRERASIERRWLRDQLAIRARYEVTKARERRAHRS